MYPLAAFALPSGEGLGATGGGDMSSNAYPFIRLSARVPIHYSPLLGYSVHSRVVYSFAVDHPQNSHFFQWYGGTRPTRVGVFSQASRHNGSRLEDLYWGYARTTDL